MRMSDNLSYILSSVFNARPYDLAAHMWRNELNGAGWINLTEQQRKEIKDESGKYL